MLRKNMIIGKINDSEPSIRFNLNLNCTKCGKKEIQGETYLDKIVFARYEKYTKTAKLSTNIEINILNVQKSSLYRNLVAWLKTQPIWNE